MTDQLRIVEVKPGVKFQSSRLKEMLPDIDTALFFSKLYELNPTQLAYLLVELFNESNVITLLLTEGQEHSQDLQDYLVELGYDELIERGLIDMTDVEPKGEILPELWKSMEIEIANSIKDVAAKLKDVVSHMPGKEGRMLFQSMATINAKRPTIGDYKAGIKHDRHPDNLVVLDCSGSITERTIRAIVEDVVALSYAADAHLAVVSETTTHWGPGEFSIDTVLAAAEYAGTHYETLVPLFDRDWGVVVTIADYDSSPAAKEAFKSAIGSIEQVLDISLVPRATFLSEVVGKLAKDVKPLLVAVDEYSCR